MSTPAGSWIGYHARVSPGQTALHDLAGGQRLSYADLDDRIARAAGALAGGFGVRHGDRVGMLSRNSAQSFEVMYACARLGAIFVPLNVRLSDPELNALASDAQPALLVGEQELLGRDVAAGLPRMSWEHEYEPAIASSQRAHPAQTGGCASSTGSRTCTSAAARTSIPPRSKTCSTSIPP